MNPDVARRCQHGCDFRCNPSVLGEYHAKAGQGKREKKGNAKSQSRREADEKNFVVACRSMGILPMIPTCPASSGMPDGGRLFFSP